MLPQSYPLLLDAKQNAPQPVRLARHLACKTPLYILNADVADKSVQHPRIFSNNCGPNSAPYLLRSSLSRQASSSSLAFARSSTVSKCSIRDRVVALVFGMSLAWAMPEHLRNK